MQRAANANVVVVTAAGNNGDSQVNGLGLYPGVIAVGISDKDDQRYMSNWGRDLDLLAPVRNTRVLRLKTVEPTGSGSSLASPQVAGAASLLLSIRPDLTAFEVESLIYAGADEIGEKGWEPETGWGRLNVRNSLILAKSHVAIERLSPSGFEIALETFPTASERTERSLWTSPNLADWKRVDDAMSADTGYEMSWLIPEETDAATPRFYSSSFQPKEDFSPRAVRVFEVGEPVSLAALLAKPIEPYVVTDRILADLAAAKAKAAQDGENFIPGFYRVTMKPEHFPYRVRYQHGEQRWPITEKGYRLDQVALALARWGTLDRIAQS